MDNVNTGVLGLGVMGSHHSRVYHEMDCLKFVCDIDEEKARYVGEKYGVGWTSNVDRFVSAMSRMDKPIVSVAVPTPLHVKTTTECLEAGINVLLEKPMAPTLSESLELAQLAKNLGLYLGVGYIEIFNPAFRYIAGLASRYEFGQITSVNIKRVGGIPRSADNVILDLMTHDFCLLMNLLQKPPSEVHTYQYIDKDDGIVNSAQSLLKFGTTSATCEANWVSPVKIRRMTITGTKECCDVDLINQTVTRITSDRLKMIHQFNKEPLREELFGFMAAVHEQKEACYVTAIDGASVLDITLQAVEKAKGVLL